MFRLKQTRFATNLYGYSHTFTDKKLPNGIPTLPRKILCVTQNYASHDNQHSSKPAPMIFSKSVESLVDFKEPILLSGNNDIHYELELALLIGKWINVSERGHNVQECARSVVGLALALDLTKKDMQNKLKASGGPWEVAKAFDRACPISSFVHAGPNWWEESREVKLVIDGIVAQHQTTDDMIFSPGELLSLITKSMSLAPGDIILTGTPMLPKATRALKKGEKLVASITEVGEFKTSVM